MAHFVRKALQLIPNQLLHQQKRYRGKINIRKPKIFYKKAVLNKLLTPFFVNPNEAKTWEQWCSESRSTTVDIPLGPYEKIISREVRNWLDKSKMVVCLHVNSIKQLDIFDTQVALFKANMHYKRYGPRIVQDAIKNSTFERLTPLLSNYTAFIFSSEINVTTVEKIVKKNRKLYIIGGVLEGQVLKLEDFMKYGEMDITTAQSYLVQVLQNAAGGNLNRQLTYHQSMLLTRLNQIGTIETTSDDKK